MRKETIIKSLIIFGLGVFAQACTSESPFSVQGEGKVFLSTEMYSDVELSSRATLDQESKQDLEDKMTIYISNEKGVIRKYSGVNNVDLPITLKVGEYVIDAWTGDSIPASYDQKYYRGQQKFSVADDENILVKLDVNIANVIVAVNTDHLDPSVTEFTVTFNHSRSSLHLDKQMVDEGKKIYFMMPNADKDLHYKVEVTGADGKVITEENDIKDVQRAHQYTLNLLSEQPENDKGGALIRIEVLDVPVRDQSFFVYPAPAFKAELGGQVIDLTQNQIDCSDENYLDFNLRVVSYYGLNSLILNFDSQFEEMEGVNGMNIWNNDMNAAETIKKLSDLGIKYDHLNDETVSDDSNSGSVTIHEGWLRFSKDFFEKLADNEKEYTIEVVAADGRTVPVSNSIVIRIANNIKAVDNKLVSSVETPDPTTQPMVILSTSATLEGILNSDDAQVYGIEYREYGSSDNFEKVYVTRSFSRAAGERFSVTITGLKPGQTYEYKCFCDDYEEQKTRTFTTETQFDIPFGNMESWSKFSNNAAFPGVGSSSTFWDSGNHGSRAIGMDITTPDDSFMNGNRVAKLKTQSILGVIAAGNLFVGEFGTRNGTKGASLTFGRSYDGSHPSALKVKVNYRPGSNPTIKSGNSNRVPEGFASGNDYGQIYVALASSIVKIDTSNEIYFDENADNILAYGEKTWNEEVGPEGGLQEIIIPLEYYNRAKNTASTHIVIVCSASKYGDFFCGSGNSVMYLDDFELVYDDIQWAN